MSAKNLAWRELRARIAASAAGHLKTLLDQTSALKRRDERLRKLIAKNERDNPGLFRKRQRKAARKNAIADERHQRASRKPANSIDRKIREINETNRKYATGMAEPFYRRLKRFEGRPGQITATGALERLRAEAMAVYEEKSADAIMRAKKPRPKKKPTYRSVVIGAMRAARKRRSSLNDFLDSAGSSPDLFTITDAKNRHRDEFCIECEGDVDSPKGPVPMSTLKGWWAEAGKKSRTD